jgi:hypothetical protein
MGTACHARYQKMGTCLIFGAPGHDRGAVARKSNMSLFLAGGPKK